MPKEGSTLTKLDSVCFSDKKTLECEREGGVYPGIPITYYHVSFIHRHFTGSLLSASRTLGAGNAGGIRDALISEPVRWGIQGQQ